jgi:hypothetical protein
MLLFGYVLLDDSWQLHERLGRWLATRLTFPSMFGLRPIDLGELTVLAVAGSSLVLMISIAYFLSSEQAKQIGRRLAVMLGLFIVFGVVVDAIHSMTLGHTGAGIAGLLEDGGEMFVMSIICGYVFTLLQSSEQTRGYCCTEHG